MRAAPIPRLVDEIMLAVGPVTVLLSDSEAAVVAVLLAGFGQLVARADLEARLFPDAQQRSRVLDGRVRRLRLRVSAVGLSIRTVRGRGYVLEYDGQPWFVRRC